MNILPRLVDTCTVRISTISKSAGSGAPERSVAETEDVPCLIQANATSTAFVDGQLIAKMTYTGFFQYGTGPLRPDDEIAWRGRTLVCIGEPQDRGGNQSHHEILLAEPSNA